MVVSVHGNAERRTVDGRSRPGSFVQDPRNFSCGTRRTQNRIVWICLFLSRKNSNILKTILPVKTYRSAVVAHVPILREKKSVYIIFPDDDCDLRAYSCTDRGHVCVRVYLPRSCGVRAERVPGHRVGRRRRRHIHSKSQYEMNINYYYNRKRATIVIHTHTVWAMSCQRDRSIVPSSSSAHICKLIRH